MTKLHPTVTEERMLEALERQQASLDNPGICTACGHEQDGCEPDARKLVCESCGEPKVYAPGVLLGVI